MSQNIRNLVDDVVASPLGEVIASVGRAVADAQQALDDAALAKTLEIYGEQGEEALQILREIGYRPTFYTLPETTGEVNVSLSVSGGSSAAGVPAPQPGVNLSFARQGLNLPAIRPKVYVTPVDAGFANRYGYQANLSAKLTFKIVPVPAPNGADELRVVPDLLNPPAGPGSNGSATVERAEQLASEFDLVLRVVDGEGTVVDHPDPTAVVGGQEPAAGSYARMDDVVTVTLA